MITVHIREKDYTYTDRLTLTVPTYADVDVIEQMLTNYSNGEYCIATEQGKEKEDDKA